MIIRVAGTTIAAIALMAGTSAFSSHPAAPRSHARHLSARHSPWGLSTYPMIPARLPVGAATVGPGNAPSQQSTNWAGYAVSRRGVKFQKITATIVVPFLNCRKTPGTFSSAWVGIDGFGDKTVEQDGISADCTGGSKPRYAAWWEVFPLPEVVTSMVIHPRDSITMSVTFNSRNHKFRMTLTDNTRHHRQHLSVSANCSASACRRTSAELISEAPTILTSSGPVQSSLADYGAERFSHIVIIDSAGQRGGILSSHWTTTKITQVGYISGTVIAFPTAVRGGSFRNIWRGEN